MPKLKDLKELRRPMEEDMDGDDKVVSVVTMRYERLYHLTRVSRSLKKLYGPDSKYGRFTYPGTKTFGYAPSTSATSGFDFEDRLFDVPDSILLVRDKDIMRRWKNAFGCVHFSFTLSADDDIVYLGVSQPGACTQRCALARCRLYVLACLCTRLPLCSKKMLHSTTL